MKLVAIAVTLACCVLMFFLNREYKLALMFMATLVLSPLVLPLKSITPLILLTFLFIVTEVKNIWLHWGRIRKSIALPYTILAVTAFLAALLTSPHLHNVNSFTYFTVYELFTKMLAFVYAFLALRNKNSLKPLLTVSFYALIFMTIMGIANYFLGYSPYIEALKDDALEFANEIRFRVQATFNNPFDYGYVCVLLAILHLYAYKQNMERQSIFMISEVCCLFGVITCNCRTIAFCYIVCLVIFFVTLQKDSRKKIIYFSAIVIAILATLLLFPFTRDLLLNILSIFDADSTVSGSSLTMRFTQMATVIYYIRGHWVFGRGVNFFNEDLGWSQGAELAADSDLQGLEGIYMQLLLERGVFGFAMFLVMMAIILYVIIKYRKLGSRLFSLGISVFSLYILFSFMTGELLSAVPTYYILGYVVANFTKRSQIVKLMSEAKCLG